jgi:hypothetical protein
MSPALASEILSFSFEADKPSYKSTLNAVAQACHVRPVFLERMPRAQRHALMVSVLAKPLLEQAAGGLIRVWLVKGQRAMLIDFLTALGISHNEGVVDDLPKEMNDAKLKTAVDALVAKYPPEAVAVYLHAFNDMNEASWANLKTMLETDSRLQLGTHSPAN